MNIYDISEQAGVSITTVSRVINNSAQVSSATREKVLGVMEKNGYTPNVFARGLGHDTMHTVGILIVDPADPNACSSMTTAVGHLQRELRSFDYDSIIYCVGYDMKDKAEYLRVMCERRVDAVIIVGSFFIESNAKNNQCILETARQVPVILINGSLEAKNVYSFLCDDKESSRRAAAAMIDAGAKDVLFLYRGMSRSEQRKRDGYLEALSCAGLPVRSEYIRCCPLDVHEGADFVEELAKQLHFDAVLATEDGIAMSVLKYANRNHIPIPEKLSLIGYDNTILAECCYPELTSVNNNVDAACITAVSMLMHRIRKGEIPSQVTVSSNIIFRETTKPPLQKEEPEEE